MQKLKERIFAKFMSAMDAEMGIASVDPEIEGRWPPYWCYRDVDQLPLAEEKDFAFLRHFVRSRISIRFKLAGRRRP
jgi:hypothetical protein